MSADAAGQPGGRCPLPGARRESAPVLTHHPVIGLLGVLLGALISTLTARITSFGLADIRGAIGAGFDQGAWIPTAYTVAQMLVAPAAAFLGVVFGPRRVLLVSSLTYGLATLALPLTGTLTGVLTFQVLAGLSSGTFIPLTIGFIVRNLPPRYLVYGIAVYAMNVELSLNFSASIEGWVIENLDWRWLFWDTALLAPLMALCIHFGMPAEPVRRDLMKDADWWGIVYASAGFAMLYAALDQGNRLDWLNSGLVIGLLLGGGLLVAAFIAQELTCPKPWITFGVLFRGNIPLLCLLLVLLRLVMLSTAFLVPQYLITVNNYRALEVGDTLLLIALPQFLLAPLVGTLLRHADPRVLMAVGFAAVGIACWLASHLTADWIGADFLPSQMLQAFGQSFAMTSLIYFNIKNLSQAHILALGALVQTARLLGGELGAAFMQTFVRVREQFHSFRLVSDVVAGDADTVGRLAGTMARVAARSTGTEEATQRALSLLSAAVRKQSYVLAYIDGFVVIGWFIVGGLLLIALLRPAPKQ